MKKINESNIINNEKFVYHTHRIVCRRNTAFKQILVDDEVNEFVNNYKTATEITNSFSIRCRAVGRGDCVTPIECILQYNLGKIALYVMDKYEMSVYGLGKLILYMKINKSKKVNYDNIKQLFINSILYTNLSSNEASFILEKLFSLSDWDLIDFFHLYGYRCNNINTSSIINNIGEHDIEKMSEYGYIFDSTSLIKMLCNGDISIKMLEKLGLNGTIINNQDNRAEIIKIYKYCDDSIIDYIEDQGFVLSKKCLDMAIEGFNFAAIFHILNQNENDNDNDNDVDNSKFQLSDKHLYKLLFVTYKIKNKPKRNKKIRRWQRIMNPYRRFNSYYSNVKTIKSIANYEQNLIDILKNNISDDNAKVISKIVGNAVPSILCAYCFDLYEYLKENYFLNNVLNKDFMEKLIDRSIEDDDLESLKKMFHYKIILPIDISTDPSYMNTAIIYNSTKMIDYFNDELKMICTRKVFKINKQLIENLEKIGYPLENGIISALTKQSIGPLIKSLIEKGYKFPNKAIQYALINNNYGLFKYLKNKGFKINCKNLMDKILQNKNKKRRFRMWKPIVFSSIKQINYIFEIGGSDAFTSKSCNILAEQGLYDCVIYLHKQMGLIPSMNALLNSLNRVVSNRNRNKNKSQISEIEYLEYIEKVMKIDIFTEIDESRLSELIYCLLGTRYENNVKILKYIIDKTNYELKSHQLDEIMGYNDNLEIVKFFEEKDIVPTKNTLLYSMISNYNNSVIFNYLYEKYKYEITLKDIHNIISREWVDINMLERCINIIKIKFTPYTVKLIVFKNLNKWRLGISKFIINCVKELTQETHDAINNSNNSELKTFMNKGLKNGNYSLVEYIPPEDEKADEENQHNVYIESDSEGENEDENDNENANDKYIKKVLREANLDDIECEDNEEDMENGSDECLSDESISD